MAKIKNLYLISEDPIVPSEWKIDDIKDLNIHKKYKTLINKNNIYKKYIPIAERNKQLFNILVNKILT